MPAHEQQFQFRLPHITCCCCMCSAAGELLSNCHPTAVMQWVVTASCASVSHTPHPVLFCSAECDDHFKFKCCSDRLSKGASCRLNCVCRQTRKPHASTCAHTHAHTHTHDMMGRSTPSPVLMQPRTPNTAKPHKHASKFIAWCASTHTHASHHAMCRHSPVRVMCHAGHCT